MESANLEIQRLQEKVRLLEKERDTLLQQLKRSGKEQVEETPREGELNFREIIDALPMPIYTTDAEGRLMHFNPAAIELAGLVPTVGREWCLTWKFYHTDGRRMQNDECPIAVSLKEGREIREVEALVKRPDGTRRWIQAHSKPAFARDGKVIGSINLLEDITERKQTEEALRREAQILAQVHDSVIASDLEGTITLWNKGAELMYGYSADEMLGQPASLIYFDEDRPSLREQMIKALPKTDPQEAEVRIRTKSGQPKFIHLSLSIMNSENGLPVGIIGYALDITERKKTEETLQKNQEDLKNAKEAAEAASAAKSEFLANMSHEIRTPMTVFLAALEHLRKLNPEPEQWKWLEIADKSAQRLRSLIDDILDFSRIEARQVELREEPFLLRSCAQDAMDLLDLSARQKDLVLELILAQEVPEKVVGDQARLSQVLVNLIGNGIKFTERGGVKVSVQVREKHLLFAINDTGPGIPKEKQKFLFRSFSQVDGTRSRKKPGTGLGLAICKGLLELMGGDIWMESCLGEGSTFFFKIPIKLPEVPEKILAKRGPYVEKETKKRCVRVLLAEDEPLVRNMIYMILNQRGHEIEVSENGREAVALWRKRSYDLILMDLQMPEMDGLEATRKIRSIEKEKGMNQTRIVALTADVRSEIQEECREVGVDEFLTKPINFEALFSAIETSYD